VEAVRDDAACPAAEAEGRVVHRSLVGSHDVHAPLIVMELAAAVASRLAQMKTDTCLAQDGLV
jgi:hypothetical protein